MEKLIAIGLVILSGLFLWNQYKKSNGLKTKNFQLIEKIIEEHFHWIGIDSPVMKEIQDIFFILERQIELKPNTFEVRWQLDTLSEWKYIIKNGKLKLHSEEHNITNKELLVKNHKNKGVYEDIEYVINATFEVDGHGAYYFSIQFPSDSYPLFIFAKSHTSQKLRGLTRDQFVETICKKLGYA